MNIIMKKRLWTWQTKLLYASSSKLLTNMLTTMKGWIRLILEVKGQGNDGMWK